MNSLFYGVRSNTRRFVVLLLLSLGAMIVDHRQHHLDNIRSTLLSAAYPLQYVADLPFRLWSAASSALVGRQQLLEQTRLMGEEIATLRRRQLRFDTLVAENARLSELLDSVSEATVPGRYLIARVLKISINPDAELIQITKGRADGIYSGQPLLDAYGIVGQITRVGSASSQAMLITDRRHSIPLRINRTGALTIGVGTGADQKLELPYLPNHVNLQEGDLLVTSGLGGTFPEGYPVAIVTHLAKNSAEQFAGVTATPLARIDRIHEVLLVWPNPPVRTETETPGHPSPEHAG